MTETFDEVYATHFRRVVVALTLDGTNVETAKDIAQEAFARTFARWPRVRGGVNPAGYVYRVAFRLQRRQRTRHPLESSIIEDVREPARFEAELIDVRRAIASLPPRQRQVILLRLVAGWSTNETALILGISEGNVARCLHDARGTVRRACNHPDMRHSDR